MLASAILIVLLVVRQFAEFPELLLAFRKIAGLAAVISALWLAMMVIAAMPALAAP